MYSECILCNMTVKKGVTMKNIKTFVQRPLKLIVDGKELKEKEIKLFEPLSYEEQKLLNQKQIYRLNLRVLKDYWIDCLDNLNEIIEMYKKMYNKTEFYERKSMIDFEKKEWDTFRKSRARLTRYYNEFKELYLKVLMEEEKNDKEIKTIRSDSRDFSESD